MGRPHIFVVFKHILQAIYCIYSNQKWLELKEQGMRCGHDLLAERYIKAGWFEWLHLL